MPTTTDQELADVRTTAARAVSARAAHVAARGNFFAVSADFDAGSAEFELAFGAWEQAARVDACAADASCRAASRVHNRATFARIDAVRAANRADVFA